MRDTVGGALHNHSIQNPHTCRTAPRPRLGPYEGEAAARGARSHLLCVHKHKHTQTRVQTHETHMKLHIRDKRQFLKECVCVCVSLLYAHTCWLISVCLSKVLQPGL